MRPSPLKDKLSECCAGPFHKTDFSIGHRGGGTLQFPEHTKESHEAGARMGAGILECDVTFTKDGELVCRHDQCDLHTTTNILVTPLAAKCSKPFSPAEFNATGTRTKAASALCCTSDLTVAEFKSLKGKMDASNPNAKTPQEYPGRHGQLSHGPLLDRRDAADAQGEHRADRAAGGEVHTGTEGRQSRRQTASGSRVRQPGGLRAGDDRRLQGRRDPAKNVWAQSFNKADVLYWINAEPAFGKQAVYLDDANVLADLPGAPELKTYASEGIRIVAPPMWALLTSAGGAIVPSQYAMNAKAAGLDIITWTLERSGRIVEEVLPTKGTTSPSFYYQTTLDALHNDGDLMTTLDVLAKKVGILGIFSDWSGTVSYYASCMGLK